MNEKFKYCTRLRVVYLSPPQRFNGAFVMDSALQGDCRRKRREIRHCFLSCACTHFAHRSLCGGEKVVKEPRFLKEQRQQRQKVKIIFNCPNSVLKKISKERRYKHNLKMITSLYCAIYRPAKFVSLIRSHVNTAKIKILRQTYLFLRY